MPAAKPTKEKILNWYIKDILESNKVDNVYQFTKLHKIKEQDFYQFFGNLEKIEAFFFEYLMEKTLETLHSSDDYVHYEAKEKMLSFYYTFFGNLTANRSFVLHLLSRKELKSLKVLVPLRNHFQQYVKTVDLQKVDFKQKDINKLQDKAFEETVWFQLLATLKFWKEDNSSGFEKTDIFIEKSLNAGFDLINVSAFKSVTDFGKFLFKEIKK